MQVNKYVVKMHRPVQWSIAIIGLSALIATFTWFLLDKSHWSFINNSYSENKELIKVTLENRKLEMENQGLLENSMMAGNLSAMDKQTATLLQDDIQGLQEEIFKLKQELEFYQGIMAGTADSTGLNIQGLNIYPLSQDRTFLLNLVLTHVAKGVKLAEGNIEVIFNGFLEGLDVDLNLKDLLSIEPSSLSFNFRNFKKFEFEVTLPDGFKPSRLTVLLNTKDKRQNNIRKVFDWSIDD
jgi:hypothetical protein